MGELGVARVLPPDLGVEVVQLGPDLLALDLQGPGSRRCVPLAAAEEGLEPVRLQGQAAFEVALPRRERRIDAAPDRGAALAQHVEQRAGARVLARLEGGAVEALAGTGGGEAHQDVDAQLVDVAAGAQKGGAELGIAQPGAERFESRDGGLGVARRLVELSTESRRARARAARADGLVDAVADGARGEERLLEERQGLRSLPAGGQSLALPPQACAASLARSPVWRWRASAWSSSASASAARPAAARASPRSLRLIPSLRASEIARATARACWWRGPPCRPRRSCAPASRGC